MYIFIYTYGYVTYGWSSPKMAITGIDARNPLHGWVTIQTCGDSPTCSPIKQT